MKDRRKLERFSLKLPAEIIVLSADQRKEKFDLVTSNICAGGAFFNTTHPLAEGIQVEIGLILSIDRLKELTGSQAYIKIRGTVRRSEPSGMAICFHEDYQMMSIKTKEDTV